MLTVRLRVDARHVVVEDDVRDQMRRATEVHHEDDQERTGVKKHWRVHPSAVLEIRDAMVPKAAQVSL